MPLRGSHRPKIFGLERRIRPQLFQSKWIGFAAPLAPGKIFTGGSWLKVAGASEPSVHVDSLPVIFGSRTVRL